MCPKWNCMLAAAVLALAFIFLPADVFNEANSFAYYVTSYEINDHGGDVIRGDRGDLSFPDRSWSRQGVKMNSTQRPEQSRTRLSVFLHLFFALSYVFMTAFCRTGAAALLKRPASGCPLSAGSDGPAEKGREETHEKTGIIYEVRIHP